VSTPTSAYLVPRNSGILTSWSSFLKVFFSAYRLKEKENNNQKE
jgi:hypothetical protein